MRVPFTLPATHADFLLVAGMAVQQNSSNPLQAAMLGMAVSPGKAYIVPGGLGVFSPDVVCDLDAGFNLVSITGTENWVQLLLEIAGTPLVPYDNLAGAISGYFAINAGLVSSKILSVINKSKPIVFVGHSLGGAIAETVAAYFSATLGLTVQGVFTLGAPKPGNGAFTDNITFPVVRLENMGDPVPSIPQPLPIPASLSSILPVQKDWAQYVQVGQALTQNGAGDWTNGHTEMSATDIIATLLAEALFLHYAETYYQYLRVGFISKANLVPFANGYEKPWKLIGLIEQPSPLGDNAGPGIPVPASFTNKYDLYQLTNDGLVWLGTFADPPPTSWVPPLLGVPATNRGCQC